MQQILSRLSLILLGFSSLLLASAVGCGTKGTYPPLGTVTGIVTVRGEPAPGVMVLFQPLHGNRSSEATTGDDGRFELTYVRSIRGAEVGEHEVSFAPVLSDDGTFANVPRGIESKKMSAQVQQGPNEFSFDLTGN